MGNVKEFISRPDFNITSTHIPASGGIDSIVETMKVSISDSDIWA
jgi:hypothetical protein